MVLAFMGMSSMVQAGPARIGGDPMRDVRATIQARKLLADDPELAKWNISVSVRDRVATLWGSVPSAEIAFRAELRLKAMIELTEVRNELFVSDLVKPMRVPLKIDNPPSLIAPELPSLWPQTPRFEPRPESWPPSHRKLPATIRFD